LHLNQLSLKVVDGPTQPSAAPHYAILGVDNLVVKDVLISIQLGNFVFYLSCYMLTSLDIKPVGLFLLPLQVDVYPFLEGASVFDKPDSVKHCHHHIPSLLLQAIYLLIVLHCFCCLILLRWNSFVYD
jgi:hypothetical protein